MSEPRYGIWVPVGGNFGPLDTPDEQIDASYERTRSLVVAKEVDPEAAMFKLFAKNPAVGGNGGIAAGLVGSYDTVATRIAAFADAGIDTCMLQFNPFAPEMTRFAEEVMPRVRHLQPVV
ncbi:MAG: hypothetical protein RMZ43_009840 [Nostoc sp. CmiVER01]|uniref:hypothetical protein n=1 Tax=Nostoc sp. CmiVER01 TaxID=3075384 RepID=UPI002AD4A92F|nr:hypothetical protein [Nostoc sp. CmiVER01]MDZ8122117.1 hypothetical protein [Nostoc sp. CmiVER01]